MLPAGLAFTFRTHGSVFVALAFGLEHVRKGVVCGDVDLFNHFANQIADLPLRSRAQAFIAQMDELTQVHGTGQVGRAGVLQNIPSVLIGDAKLLQIGVRLSAGAHAFKEQMQGFGVIGNRGRNDRRAILHVTVALTLNTKANEAVSSQLSQQSAGHSADLPSKGHVFQDTFVAGRIALPHNATIRGWFRLIALASRLLNGLNRGMSETS